MRFRPCIDIHNGKVKQIVGGSLKDEGDAAKENFVSDKNSSYYASLYKNDGLIGAHVIMLNAGDSEYADATKHAALEALAAYPSGLQIGGGINPENAASYINAGASHVIVTSCIFHNGAVSLDNLKALVSAVGKEHIVIDLSCRRKADGKYYVVTNRWQTFTDEEVTYELFETLKQYCDEFLVHGVDMEGRKSGMEEELVKILSEASCAFDITITYAGGIASLDDVEHFECVSKKKLNYTIGSALDIFGGNLSYKCLVEREKSM